MAQSAIDRARATFETAFAKSYGENSLARGESTSSYEVISTGSLLLDQALGVGGTIQGRLSEFWGPEGVGKSSLALLGVAQAQKKDPKAFQGWIDMERTYDPAWAVKLGVDPERLYVAQPDSAEDVADIAKDMLRAGFLNKLVIDSVGGMVSRAEQEKGAEDATVGIIAKIVTRMVKIGAVESGNNAVDFWIINQVRARIGGGPLATTTRGGGFALGHATTHRVKLRRSGDTPLTIGKKSDSGDDTVVQVGLGIVAQVEKNKVASPGRVARMTLLNQATEKYGPVGIDLATEAHVLGTRYDLFERYGHGVVFADGTKTKSRDETIAHLRQNPQVIRQIRLLALKKVAHELRTGMAEG